jgi:hypothetical protein
MILLAGIIIYLQQKSTSFKILSHEWSLIVLGALIILGTFMWDYSEILITQGFLPRFWTLAEDPQFLKIMYAYHPTHYSWVAFILAEMLILGAIALMFRRVKS